MPKVATQNQPHELQSPTARLTIQTPSGQRTLTPAQAFDQAHRWLLRGKLNEASQVLDWLEQALSADRRVEVLKARCQARLGQYAECSRILSSTFGSTEELKDVAGALHTAIVYCASGLFPAARDELETLCSRHQGLPSVWLFIGDVWQTVGRSDKAMQLWSTAAQNDYEPALIAPTARHRIREAIEEERLAPQKSLSQTR